MLHSLNFQRKCYANETLDNYRIVVNMVSGFYVIHSVLQSYYSCVHGTCVIYCVSQYHKIDFY